MTARGGGGRRDQTLYPPPPSLLDFGWEVPDHGRQRQGVPYGHSPFFFYHGIHSLMFGGDPPTAIGYPPTTIGYTPTTIGYPPTAIVGRIGHSEFSFLSLRHPLGKGAPRKICLIY